MKETFVSLLPIHMWILEVNTNAKALIHIFFSMNRELRKKKYIKLTIWGNIWADGIDRQMNDRERERESRLRLLILILIWKQCMINLPSANQKNMGELAQFNWAHNNNYGQLSVPNVCLNYVIHIFIWREKKTRIDNNFFVARKSIVQGAV